MWEGNLDGRRDGLVIAYSKAAALRAMNKKMRVSRNCFDEYFCEQEPIANLLPDTLYVRAIDHGLSRRDSEWTAK